MRLRRSAPPTWILWLKENHQGFFQPRPRPGWREGGNGAEVTSSEENSLGLLKRSGWSFVLRKGNCKISYVEIETSASTVTGKFGMASPYLTKVLFLRVRGPVWRNRTAVLRHGWCPNWKHCWNYSQFVRGDHFVTSSPDKKNGTFVLN